jgi:hypothetical protein
MAVVYAWVPNGVARMAGNHEEMDRVARHLLLLAKRRATAHILTSAYIRGLRARNVPGKKGVRDRLVEATDKAAMSIEYGHAVRLNKAGPNQANFKWVPGQYILTGAIGMIPGYKENSFGIVKGGRAPWRGNASRLT